MPYLGWHCEVRVTWSMGRELNKKYPTLLLCGQQFRQAVRWTLLGSLLLFPKPWCGDHSAGLIGHKRLKTTYKRAGRIRLIYLALVCLNPTKSPPNDFATLIVKSRGPRLEGL